MSQPTDPTIPFAKILPEDKAAMAAWNLLQTLITMVTIEHAEKEVLVKQLVAAGLLPEEQCEKARQEARQAALDAVAEILGTGGATFDDLLRKFHGPVQ